MRIRIQHFSKCGSGSRAESRVLMSNLSLGLNKGRTSYRRSLEPSKENIQPALQNMKIIYFFLYLWVIFAHLDPDPATQMKVDLVCVFVSAGVNTVHRINGIAHS
jgi:hypothetical protein